VTPKASNSRLNSLALTLRSADRGAPPRHLSRSLVSSGLTHQAEAAQAFAKNRIADIAGSIQDDGACLFISRRCLQWQFNDKAGCMRARHGLTESHCGIYITSGFAGRALNPGMNAGARRAF